MTENKPFENRTKPPGIKHIVLVGSGKGGVGKSTVSINLALGLKNLDLNVGLLDADIYGPSIPRMMGAINQVPEVDSDKKIYPVSRMGISLMSIGFLIEEEKALVWRGPMLFQALNQFFNDVLWKDIDVLVVDLPPGTGDIALTIAQKYDVSAGIIVSTPQNVSLADAKKAFDMFEQVKIPVMGLVENMSSFTPPGSSEKISLFPKGELDTYLAAKNYKKLSELPFHPNVGLGSEAGIPIIESDSKSDVAQAFTTLAKDCKDFLNI